MQALADSYLFWAGLIFGLALLYILPTVIAVIRGVQGLGWLIVLNLLPTGVGWPAALLLACTLPRRDPLPALAPPAPWPEYQPPPAHTPYY